MKINTEPVPSSKAFCTSVSSFKKFQVFCVDLRVIFFFIIFYFFFFLAFEVLANHRIFVKSM